MKSENVRTIAVVGAGAMGHAIAQEFARVGYHVNLYDVTEDALKHALENVKANLELMVDVGLATAEEASATPGRIRTGTDLASTVAASFSRNTAASNSTPPAPRHFVPSS